MTEPPLVWQDGVPRSRRFGDIYYSLEDGLAESRAVFLAGCGLPDAWAGRRHFVVGELGFGTGLNIAALLHLWAAARPAGGRLQVFSTEAYPPSRQDAARALAAWPELDRESAALLAQWPTGRRGVHRIDLPQWNAILDIAVMDVEQGLAQWEGRADAWFLDGFSPALNPGMWTDDVLAAIARRSRAGAVAATFTVASAVRRGLETQGFAVAKQPGHGRKRERLEARLAGRFSEAARPGVIIVGAGIAGASLARALRALGLEPLVLADAGLEAASGNPAALVTPALDAGGGGRARLYAEAFARAGALYEAAPGAILARGALQRRREHRDEARFRAVALQDFFDPASLTETAEGLRFANGLVIRPKTVLPAWTGRVVQARVQAVRRGGDCRWTVETDQGGYQADHVILAAGWSNAALAPDLALQAVRGQASWAAGPRVEQAQAFGAYVLPTDDGVLFGATNDRDDQATDVRVADHHRNLAALAEAFPELAEKLRRIPLDGRAAIRTATPDRLPVAGQVQPGLWMLGGLGSRGFTTAPLLAEHVAASLLDQPSPLAADLAALVSPGRERLRR